MYGYDLYHVSLLIGVVHPKGSSINHVVKFLGIFDPPPLPSWPLLLNKTYVCYKMVTWKTSLNSLHGLCMTKNRDPPPLDKS